MISYEIKTCPFCGVFPQVNLGAKRGCQLHGEPMQGVFVRCANNKCLVRPQTQEFGDVYCDKEQAVKQAVDAWNYRPCNEETKNREFKL